MRRTTDVSCFFLCMSHHQILGTLFWTVISPRTKLKETCPPLPFLGFLHLQKNGACHWVYHIDGFVPPDWTGDHHYQINSKLCELERCLTNSPWCSMNSCQSANTLGRRRALLTTAALFVVSPLLSALSPNYAVLLFGRHPAGGFSNWSRRKMGNQGQCFCPLKVEPEFLLSLFNCFAARLNPCGCVGLSGAGLLNSIDKTKWYRNGSKPSKPRVSMNIMCFLGWFIYLPTIFGIHSNPYVAILRFSHLGFDLIYADRTLTGIPIGVSSVLTNLYITEVGVVNQLIGVSLTGFKGNPIGNHILFIQP